jgi:tRNA-splicing ligase RtcB
MTVTVVHLLIAYKMAKLKLRGKDLRAIGYPEGPVISIAMNIMEKNYKFDKEEDVMNLLKAILASPVEYTDDAILGLIAQQLMPKPQKEGASIDLNEKGIDFNVRRPNYPSPSPAR